MLFSEELSVSLLIRNNSFQSDDGILVTGISADVPIFKTYTNKTGPGYVFFRKAGRLSRKRIPFLILFSKKVNSNSLFLYL
jgi:hypothetical protein